MQIPLEHIIQGTAITIVIQIYLYQCPRIGAEPSKNIQEVGLLVHARVPVVQNGEVNLLKEQLYFFLFSNQISGLNIFKTKGSNLQHYSHIAYNKPEDLTADIKHVPGRAGSISAEGQAQVLLNRVDKSGGLATARALDCR